VAVGDAVDVVTPDRVVGDGHVVLVGDGRAVVALALADAPAVARAVEDGAVALVLVG
jgi:hypothetical protein